MHRADAANSAANRAAGALEPPLAEQWRVGPLGSSGRRTVATSRETVFLTNRDPDAFQSTLRARAASDGALRWEFSPAGETVEGTPAVVGDTVYAGGDALYAVAAGDGSELFRFDPGADDLGAPVVAEGTVLVAGDRTVYALDPATGDELWTFDAGGALLAPPSVKRGVAYLGVGDESVVALDVASGDVRWRSDAPGRQTSVFGGHVVTNNGRNLAVLSASDGRLEWRLDPPRSVVVTAQVVAGGRVFVLTGGIAIEWDDGVHAFDVATGRRRWHRDVGIHPLFERADDSLALGGNALYVAGINGSVTALHSQTGRTQFRFDLDEPIKPMPVPVKDGLYLAGVPNAAAPSGSSALVSVVEADRTV